MKKFITLALAGAISLTNASLVMATAPAPAPTPIVASDFAKVSFEDTEPVIWTFGTGSENAGTMEMVSTEGVKDGAKALKVNIKQRSADWGKLTTVTLNAPTGAWGLTKYDTLKVTVTNPNSFDLNIRMNLNDTHGNGRMAFFKIPANQTREVAIADAIWGEPGVKNGSWADDGYGEKGIDPGALKAIRFYVAEPTPEQMPGQTSMSFIIDNLYVEKGVVPSGNSYSILSVKPSKTETSAAFYPLPSVNFKAVLGDKLIGGEPPTFPTSMTVQLKKDGKNLPTAADGTLSVKAGDKVTLHVQMFKSYSLKNNVGTTNLDVTLSSPTIKVLSSTQSQSFVDSNTIGTLTGLNFDFIMPEGNVDVLKDFKWDFKLTPQ